MKVTISIRTLLFGATLAAAAAAAPSLGAQQSAPPDGRMLFLKNCRTCHGATGVPSKQSVAKYEKIKNLADATFMSGRSDDSVVAVIRHGVNQQRDMKAFEGKLSPEEMRAVAVYVRTLWSKPATSTPPSTH